MRTDHVNTSATSPHHLYFFSECHSVPVYSRDFSGEITGITKFHGRSEILAGKFHTRIYRNDWNLAGICGITKTSGGGGKGEVITMTLGCSLGAFHAPFGIFSASSQWLIACRKFSLCSFSASSIFRLAISHFINASSHSFFYF